MFRKLKHEVLRKALEIPRDRLDEYFGRHAVERRQVGVEHHLVRAHEQNASADIVGRDGVRFHGLSP